MPGAAGEGTTSSGRLRVRRPTAADLGDVQRIHADPRTTVQTRPARTATWT